MIVRLVVMAGAVSWLAVAAPLPAGYTCAGFCGTLGANGDVPLSPLGTPAYLFVGISGNSANGTGALPTGALGSERAGSKAVSATFGALTGDSFTFYFDYVTSDGAGYADYAWAALYHVETDAWTVLFTARTLASGSIVPGLGMPAPAAMLTPGTVSISPGATWAPLAGYSGQCYAAGCGNTGWVQSSYAIAESGTYQLAFGVTNWNDNGYFSGLAVDGVMRNGEPVGTVPEPGAELLGLSGIVYGLLVRRRAAILSF